MPGVFKISERYKFKKMSHLTKYQYDNRRENAAARMIKNSGNPALTEEQHEALTALCSARHELHSNKRQVIINDFQGLKQHIIYVNISIRESGLKPMNFVGTDNSDYIDIDCIDELNYNNEETYCENHQNWYDNNYFRISDELETLNSKIESYLKEIDEKYKTNYTPSGELRIF